MKCLNDNCDNVLTGRQRTFCSDKCRKAISRTNKAIEDGRQGVNSDRPDHKSDTLSGFSAKSDTTPAILLGVPGMPTATEVALGINPRPATNPNVQAIWDRRNTQGQPSLYGDWPDRTKTETIA